MRDGGDILTLGQNIKQAMAEITADLPLGIAPKLVADQAVTVKSAISEFMTSLWQAVAIILVVSFISLGVRPGLVIALAIPLTLAVVFSVMELHRHRHAAHIAGSAHHRARAARRRCHDDHRRHAHAAGRGRRQGAGRDVRVPHLRVRHARRHARHHRRLRPGRLCGKLGRRIHVLALCRRRHRAHRVLVRGGHLRAAAGRRDPDTAAKRLRTTEPGRVFRSLPRLPRRGHAGEVADDPAHAWRCSSLRSCASARAPAILSLLGSPRASRRSQPAAECVDLCQRNHGPPLRCRPHRGRGRGALEHLCGPGRHPLLSAAQRAVAERFLRPGR